MSNEVFTSYWIGQEPTGPGQSPTLNEMPDYVNVVPLAFVGITSNYQLDFTFLCQQNSAATIQGWIKDVRANGTKVLLSINSSAYSSIPDAKAFAQTVQQSVEEWGVDGVDVDYEPPVTNQNVIEVVSQLRNVLGNGALLTAPIYAQWDMDFLHQFAVPFDYLTTMDYTPYPGFDSTIDLVNQYAKAIGTSSQPQYEKLAIGISCMNPATNDFTPLDDVVTLSKWEPKSGNKQGAMLYTYSYDIKTRPKGGTGYPNGTWTETIHNNLP